MQKIPPTAAPKPMYEFFASYDIYHMIRRRNRCAMLRQKWLQCKEQMPNECTGKRHCKQEFKDWLHDCAELRHPNPKTISTEAD